MLSHESFEPLIVLTDEEERWEVDRKLYGITDDPSVVYPWKEPEGQIQDEQVDPNFYNPPF